MRRNTGVANISMLAVVAALAAAVAMFPHRGAVARQANPTPPAKLHAPVRTVDLVAEAAARNRAAPQSRGVSTASRFRLARFRRLDDLLRDTGAGARGDPVSDEALEIVIAEVDSQLRQNPDLTEARLNAAMKPFVDVADRGACGGPGLSFAIAAHNSLRAIAVTYNLLSRAAIFDRTTDARLRVPNAVEWSERWSQRPVFFPDGSLAIVSDQMREEGSDNSFRVLLLARSGRGYRLLSNIERTNTLDWGGIVIRGDRMTMVSKDYPQAMISCASCTDFPRKEIYRVRRGVARRIALVKEEPELRFLDAWMARANAAKRPDRLQRDYLHYSHRQDGDMEVSSFFVKPRQGKRLVIEYRDPDYPIRFAFVLTSQAPYKLISITGLSRSRRDP